MRVKDAKFVDKMNHYISFPDEATAAEAIIDRTSQPSLEVNLFHFFFIC